jgi:NodT family efflux transporter outer membrane factor (OMF) lipoprotein
MAKKTTLNFKLRTLLFFTLSTINSGCFKSADKDKESLYSSPSLKKSEEIALSSAFLEIENKRREKWWEVFESTDLNILIEEAISCSPTLQAAEAKIVAAQAAAKSIRSKLFPELSANAVDNWSYLSKYGFFRNFFPLPPTDVIPSKFNELDLSLNFSYELDFWGKNRKKFSEALGLAVAQQMEKIQTELVLCEAVAFTYFEWQAHTAEKKIYEKWLDAEKKLSFFYSSRFEVGVDNTLPPLAQNQKKGEIEQKIVELEKKREVDIYFLNSLLGRSPDHGLKLQYRLENLAQKIQIPENLGLDLLSQRPDLMAQIWKVSAASDAIGVAKTEFYPNVNLSALAGLSSLTFSNFFDWASRTGSLTPAIHLPIFTGGQLRANLNQKVALYNEEVSTYNEMLLNAAKQVAEDITTFTSLETQREIQKNLVKLQTQSYEVSCLRYEKGVDDFSPVLHSSEALFSQKINEIYLDHAQILSALRIIQSLGGGMQPQKLPPSIKP